MAALGVTVQDVEAALRSQNTELPSGRIESRMREFTVLAETDLKTPAEFERRFHAETLGCAACGPCLTLVRLQPQRAVLGGNEPALQAAVALLDRGGIVAVKGIGGYHLMCDAASDTAVAELRSRKRRPDKPVAVMFPEQGQDGLECVRRSVVLDGPAMRILTSRARPIVLAPRRADCPLSRALAPGLGELGVMLPYSPLHHTLLSDIGRPLVATSANISGEPVTTEADETERKLVAVADAFLHHDRGIVRSAEDAVVRIVAGRPRTLRLGRSTAPLEIKLERKLRVPVLAIGGHTKVALGLGAGDRALLWPHLGDLDSPRAIDLLTRHAVELPRLYGIEPERIACDLHPGYAGTRWASRHGLPVLRIQHHAAHASALAAENPGIARWLVFAWDGVGYGEDGTLWGGEALLGRPGAWRRVASFRPFRPPGGDLAARQPWRSAVALLWETESDFACPIPEAHLRMARTAWERDINCPRSSAVGRLFDAAAALLLGRMEASYEGQAPMELEALAERAVASDGVPLSLPIAPDRAGILRTDWAPLFEKLADVTVSASVRARTFHLTMARALVAQVEAVAGSQPDTQTCCFDAVGLTGGVFQNRRLAESAVTELAALGVRAVLPHCVPAGDGGLALGQIVESAALLERGVA
jgi:hydrogenase maturation protein HypF